MNRCYNLVLSDQQLAEVAFQGLLPHIKEKYASPGLIIPTGAVKPAGSVSGIPDRFDRKPVQTG